MTIAGQQLELTEHTPIPGRKRPCIRRCAPMLPMTVCLWECERNGIPMYLGNAAEGGSYKGGRETRMKLAEAVTQKAAKGSLTLAADFRSLVITL